MLKNKLQVVNLFIGIAIVILFAITGQLMRRYYHNEVAADVERLFRRSRHLYLLLAGLTQGGIGIYIQAYQNRISLAIQWFATVLMTVAAALLIYSFFFEIPSSIIKTPFSKIALYILLASVGLHFIGGLWDKYVFSKSK